MANRYHINPKTGSPGSCSASEGKCPFGGEHQHYGSEARARVAYELSMASETFSDAPAHKEASQPSLDLAEKKPYPVEGDSVIISSNANVASSSLIEYRSRVALMSEKELAAESTSLKTSRVYNPEQVQLLDAVNEELYRRLHARRAH